MEKIININFQGRVIPIEETAYNDLKKYTDSLRAHFANEESSDEIISDIENRISELLNDRLKRGAVCIVMADINAVIDSIGRLEDIEAAEGEETRTAPKNQALPGYSGGVKGRFYRNADDKVIAGVCSGIAIRAGIDPMIVRIVFVLLFGALLWLYIILWIIVPSQSIQSNITRRLYRNPDDKFIAGVCGGLAAYLRIESWIPRLVFGLPVLVTIITGGFHLFWWHWQWWGLRPRIFVGSFGSTLFIMYIVLWIALPFASSATDMMEMRGEKIDLNSIKAASQAKSGTGPYPGNRGSGIGRIIATLFKAFFLFIAGVLALSLFGVLIGLVFTGFVAFPFTDFFLDGWQQYTLVWVGTFLFLGIPFLALITWLIRRLTGVRSHRHYLGFVFAFLWFAGLVGVLTLSGILIRNFNSRSEVEDTFPVQQPSVNKLYVNVINSSGYNNRHRRWLGDWEEGDSPFDIINNDSLWLNTVKVNVDQSPDSLFHIYETRISRGKTTDDARSLASHISFNISQQDSVIGLPRGFSISNKDKFRNQQVLITVEVPLGKTIQFNKGVNRYSWFNINTDGGQTIYFKRHWRYNRNRWQNSEYIMTANGLRNAMDSSDDSGDDDDDN